MPPLTYDPAKPIAVFLGPSLPRDEAESLIEANFYPPAVMGDVYRLLALGSHTIVLIDGIFHGQAAVWQRELLAAIEAGIRVIGASSMGALRAAELHPLGMIGVGRIFSWYRDGLIDGDDEVALFHAGPERNYRAISEPLVNMRHNLDRAVAAAALTRDEADALLSRAKSTYFGERSYVGLFAACKGDPAAERFAAFLERGAIDLKREDAREALRHAAASPAPPARPPALPAPSRFYADQAARHTGLQRRDGRVISGDQLLAALQKEPKTYAYLRRESITHFILAHFADQLEIKPPDMDAFEARRLEQLNVGDRQAWLAANGLTPLDFRRALQPRARTEQLLASPERHGVEPLGELTTLFAGVPEVGTPEQLQRHALQYALLTSWAERNGLEPPEAYRADHRKRYLAVHGTPAAQRGIRGDSLERLLRVQALCAWLYKLGPNRLGYTSWSESAAILEMLRVSGLAARLAARLEAPS